MKMLTNAVLILAMFTSTVLMAAPPEISDPNGMAPAGAMPGTFPETVTAANLNAAPIAGSVLGGSGSDNILASFPSSGPIAWTESRHNEGDIALSIGPFDPNDASYFPPTSHVNNYKPLADGEPFANTTLAWRVGRVTGALMATVRHNGVDNQDTFAGSPVGITHGVAYFNAEGQGWGYRMSDGVFANGGDGSADLQMGVAGFNDGAGEAVFNTAVAYFPYSEGWQGAWVASGLNGVGEFSSGTPDLDPSAVNWSDGVANVTLPDVNASTDGMLFVAPTNGDNDTDIAAAFPNGAGWTVTLREDEAGADEFKNGGNSFQFLYVPYNANDLVGGHIEGTTGNSLASAGDNRFSINRTEAGEYAVSVFATDGTTKLNEDDGTLMLSVAASQPDNAALADRKFMSYEYDSASGDFIVQSRELVAINSPASLNTFGDELALRDVDFYFTFVDFENPLSLGTVTVTCDFDGNGTCDISDIDSLVSDIAAGSNTAAFDLTGDGSVTNADRDAWLIAAGAQELASGGSYLIGDANLNGEVDSTDLGLLLNNFGATGGVSYSGGDLNADANVDSTDLGLLLNNFGSVASASQGAAAVPEPNGLSLFLLAAIGCLSIRRRR